jgi:hypothetical protein
LTALPGSALKDRVATVVSMARLVRYDIADYLDQTDSESSHDGDDIPLRSMGKPDGSWKGKHTHKQPGDTRRAKFDPKDHTACDFVMANDKPLPKGVTKSLRQLAIETERFAEWVTESMSAFGPKEEIIAIEAASHRKRPRTWQKQTRDIDLTATGNGPREKVLRVLQCARALQSSSPETVIFDVNQVREAAMNVANAAEHHRSKLAMKMKSSRLFQDLRD